MKALFSVLLALVVTAAGTFAQSSFNLRGLRVGMSRIELDSLVAASRWGYIYQADQDAASVDDGPEDVAFLGADGHESELERSLDGFSWWTGEPAGAFDYVGVHFGAYRVEHIFVSGQSIPVGQASTLSLAIWSALMRLRDDLGRPRNRVQISRQFDLDYVRRAHAALKNTDYLLVAEWRFPVGGVESPLRQVRLYLSQDSEDAVRVKVQISASVLSEGY